jgi:malonyl-CoA decarboxylase
MAANSFVQLLTGFSRGSRTILRKYAPFAEWERAGVAPVTTRLEALCHALMGVKGEASGVAIAADVLDSYSEATTSDQLVFFRLLAERYAPDAEGVKAACTAYLEKPSAPRLGALMQAVETPRRELFRRLNLAPSGTSRLVEMRSDLLSHLKTCPELAAVDDDLTFLLQSWFNRGFLEMRRLSWSSPADVLERIIRYEAVHSIKDWADLRSRLDPADRRCFAFFHPAMPDEPLIFVEVAFTVEIPDNIRGILDPPKPPIDLAQARCAVFYSISNCQKGLQGISFGNFLIKQVVADLSRELPQLQHFVTLSPAPGFLAYLRTVATATGTGRTDGLETMDVERLARTGWWEDATGAERLREIILPHALNYFLEAKLANGKPVDSVARFHLGNGARLERINWRADQSDYGQRQSGGMMVNYLYDLSEVEENHEAFANRGVIATGKPIRHLVKTFESRGLNEGEPRRHVLARLSGRLPVARVQLPSQAEAPKRLILGP